MPARADCFCGLFFVCLCDRGFLCSLLRFLRVVPGNGTADFTLVCYYEWNDLANSLIMFAVVLVGLTTFFCASSARRRARLKECFSIPRQINGLHTTFRPAVWAEICRQARLQEQRDLLLASFVDESRGDKRRPRRDVPPRLRDAPFATTDHRADATVIPAEGVSSSAAQENGPVLSPVSSTPLSFSSSLSSSGPRRGRLVWREICPPWAEIDHLTVAWHHKHFRVLVLSGVALLNQRLRTTQRRRQETKRARAKKSSFDAGRLAATGGVRNTSEVQHGNPPPRTRRRRSTSKSRQRGASALASSSPLLLPTSWTRGDRYDIDSEALMNLLRRHQRYRLREIQEANSSELDATVSNLLQSVKSRPNAHASTVPPSTLSRSGGSRPLDSGADSDTPRSPTPREVAEILWMHSFLQKIRSGLVCPSALRCVKLQVIKACSLH